MAKTVRDEHTTDLLEDTKLFWEKQSGRDVTLEEAREMIANIVDFFSLLAKWDAAAN